MPRADLIARVSAEELVGWAALLSLENEEGEAERTRIQAEHARPPEGSDEALQRELTARAQGAMQDRPGAGRR